jgi:hypothetical protein
MRAPRETPPGVGARCRVLTQSRWHVTRKSMILKHNISNVDARARSYCPVVIDKPAGPDATNTRPGLKANDILESLPWNANPQCMMGAYQSAPLAAIEAGLRPRWSPVNLEVSLRVRPDPATRRIFVAACSGVTEPDPDQAAFISGRCGYPDDRTNARCDVAHVSIVTLEGHHELRFDLVRLIRPDCNAAVAQISCDIAATRAAHWCCMVEVLKLDSVFHGYPRVVTSIISLAETAHGQPLAQLIGRTSARLDQSGQEGYALCRVGSIDSPRREQGRNASLAVYG